MALEAEEAGGGELSVAARCGRAWAWLCDALGGDWASGRAALGGAVCWRLGSGCAALVRLAGEAATAAGGAVWLPLLPIA